MKTEQTVFDNEWTRLFTPISDVEKRACEQTFWRITIMKPYKEI
jgi:hypothetical protein